MKKRTTKRALLTSAISLLLCVSMLIGSTFAWFTDSVVSGMNTIYSGNLDVELLANGEKVEVDTKLFDDVKLWEPGVVVYENLQVANVGNLALQYQMSLNFGKENELEGHKLSEVLKVAVIDKIDDNADRETVLNAAKASANVGSLYDFFVAGSLEAGQSSEEQGVVIFWAASSPEIDNLYNANNGKTTSDGEPLRIEFGVKLVATQMMDESDSFNNEYDSNAAAEFFPGFQGGTAYAAVKTDDQGFTTSAVSMAGGDVSAEIPAGVKVVDGTASMKLSVTLKSDPDANVDLNESEEMRHLDVHIEGVADGNTTAMLITLKHYLSTGINTGALRLYHVENNVSVPMTQVASPVNHNEFSYDSATGDLTLAMASFSEVAVVADANNPWDGTAATAFSAGAGTQSSPYLITNADELAYFRNEVDGGNTFAGEIVKLENSIQLNSENFDPIGWGYVNADHNRNDAAGKVFQGTFDGNGKTIFGLYQSGWDLESETGTDYTYTNCGFGLFAAASDATFKNLTISGAEVTVECVEAGILVGLSQNNCTYDNIKIYNSKIANYQRPAGGLIGEVSGAGTTTITNVIIGSDVVVGSLWGDFDAPVGGVIGARWDDAEQNPQIVMQYVDVSCRLDVYNDVTSAYQWHAYRRAGMLIGNTDTPAANGKIAQTATADFLHCIKNEGNDTVIVRLGHWANYHYCQFTNEQNPGRNYPWVRVEAGENCSAYSNPRYGHPTDANGTVVDGTTTHKHKDGDTCNMQIAFAQLYGGGQGVYGATAHEGVAMEGYRYSIIYVNNDDVLSIQYVTDEMAEKTKPFIPNDKIAEDAVVSWLKEQGYTKVVFDCWVTAGSKKVEIPASNTENVTVYPSFTTPYTARFVDLDGNVLSWCLFNEDKTDTDDLEKTEGEARNLLPALDNVTFSKWEVHIVNSDNSITAEAYDTSKFKGKNCYKTDVTIYPVYTYSGNLNLVPVDDDGDGKTNYYRVEAIKQLDVETVIPGSVLGIPVKVVNKLYKNDGNWDFGSGVETIIIQEGVEELAHNSLGYTEDLTLVKLPSTLKVINKNAFSRNTGDDKKVLTIEFNGTMAEWKAISKNGDWHNGLKTGTKVICTDGYFQLDVFDILIYQNYSWTEHPNA